MHILYLNKSTCLDHTTNKSHNRYYWLWVLGHERKDNNISKFSNTIWFILSPKVIIPEVLSFIQMQRCNPKPYCRVLLYRERRLSTITPSKKVTHIQPFSNWTSTFNMLSEACRVWGMALWFFCTYSVHLLWICWEVHSWETAALCQRRLECSRLGNCLNVCFYKSA